MSTTAPQTIGVLTPYTGGFYYGAILAGIHRAARRQGYRVLALQTTGLELLCPDEPVARGLALKAVDGWIAVSEFKSARYTSQLTGSGKPLVYLSERPTGVACCSVLPDNHGGMMMAVRHLIDHGHRRIAFAGFLGQLDLRERYEGYLAAHQEAGLQADRSLLYWTPNNLEADGREVGNKLLEANLPCTAVIGGTDKLALGVLEVLTDAGINVPKDIALVGFDDVEKAQYIDPPLSTVRQRFDLLATRAAETLMAHLASGEPLPATVRVPTALVIRRSCGCNGAASHSTSALPQCDIHRERVLARSLLEVAGARNLGALEASAWPGATTIAKYLGTIALGKGDSTDALPSGLWAGFLAVNRDVESIERAMELLEDAARQWCALTETGLPDAHVERALLLGLRQLRVDLMRQWRMSEHDRSRYYDFVAEANGKINNALTGSGFTEAGDLSWLQWTRLSYGCLALWRPPTEIGVRHLEVVGEYGAQATSLLAKRYQADEFPPPEAQHIVGQLGDENLLIIVPITGSDGNHGLLTVAGPIEVELLDHVGSIGDWAALVGARLEREAIETQLRETALRDALTGLPNRALLMERLETLLEAAGASTHSRFAVLFLDLDDFKNINDSLGHVAGDQLLVAIAKRLDESLRPGDTIARLGGDEFAILVPDVDTQPAALDVVTRVQDSLKAPFELDGNVVFTSCSIGVTFNSATTRNATELLRDADTAMYRAKLEGRAGHEIFNRGMHTQAVERLRLTARLRYALEKGEFALHYQPLVSLKNRRAIGAEALIRWNHPQQGFLSPSHFLSVAEEVGLAVPISKWVIDTACQEAKEWQCGGHPAPYVNVNIPAQHLKDPDFIGLIKRTLEKYQLSPTALGLELVEGSLIEDQHSTIQTLNALRELGVSTAIDDFGTGYSSLSYLKRFPINILKIDRSFVDGVPDDPHDKAIVKAVIAMSHSLNLAVVAEGVERLEQLHFLEAEGCDVVQGYLLSRPLPAGECRQFFLSGQAADSLLEASG